MIVLIVIGAWVLLSLLTVAFFRGAALANRAEDRRRAAEEAERPAQAPKNREDATLFAAFELPPVYSD